MQKTENTAVADLRIDLHNFRSVPQSSEIQAVQAMIAIETEAEKFWALMHSLLDNGYLPTENIIVLQTETSENMVMEGNRRVAALKLVLGYLPSQDIPIPSELVTKITTRNDAWKQANKLIPCAIYPASEVALVDKIVALTHGKGELGGRSDWNALATARHNREKNKGTENGLDLLEKYLDFGGNLNKQQAKRWAGDYNLTVLDEAIRKIAVRFGAKNAAELAKNYPDIIHRSALDEIMLDIGVEILTFTVLRTTDFLTKYLPSSDNKTGDASNTQPKDTGAVAPASGNTSPNTVNPKGNVASENGSISGSNANTGSAPKPTGSKVAAVAIGDPRSVKRTLRKFSPLGNNRQKVVTLRNEALKLKLDDNPIAFCFLLRSMFEISAKAYCDDHQATGGPSYTKANGEYYFLAEVLEKITQHLTNNKQNVAMVKVLHGAMTELKKKEGILSVTSMNQLVHHPTFSIIAKDVAILFGNIYPLLEAMNA
jgi:hypothetical protein